MGGAERIAEALTDRYPDAQAVETGRGFVKVYWTDTVCGELRSYMLGDADGSFGVDTYQGEYMRSDDALFLWPHGFDDLAEPELIAELLRGEVS